MHNFLTLSMLALLAKSQDIVYPESVFVVRQSYNDNCYDIKCPVYELLDDAMAVYEPLQSEQYKYDYHEQKFYPPTCENYDYNFPNHCFPVQSYEKYGNNLECPTLMNKVWACDQSAQDYCAEHTNDDFLYMYNICGWVPASNSSSFFKSKQEEGMRHREEQYYKNGL